MNLNFDFPGILDLITGLDNWEKAEVSVNPTDYIGVAYGYKTGDGEHEAIVVVDEAHLHVEVDGSTMYDGDWSQDPDIRSFVQGDLPPFEEED